MERSVIHPETYLVGKPVSITICNENGECYESSTSQVLKSINTEYSNVRSNIVYNTGKEGKSNTNLKS